MKDMTEEEMVEEYQAIFVEPGVIRDQVRTNRALELLSLMSSETRIQMADWHVSEICRIVESIKPV